MIERLADIVFGWLVIGLALFGAAATPPPPPAEPVTVVAVGDIMFSRFYDQPVRDHLAPLFATHKQVFDEADLVLGNLEGVIAPPGPPQNIYDFAFKDAYASTLARYGFDAVSLANNHSFDQGQSGYEATIEKLAAVGVGSFGHQVNPSALVYIHTVDEQIIAVHGLNLAGTDPAPVQVQQQLAQQASTSDYQLVLVHWGEEYVHHPTERQRQWGRDLVNWGADAVIGGHPHVTQGMEVYEGAPIFWSLGNFIFDQQFSDAVQEGILAELTFTATSTQAKVIPYRLHSHAPQVVTTDYQARLAEFWQWSELPDSVTVATGTGVVIIPH